jgi:hypothetical protein
LTSVRYPETADLCTTGETGAQLHSLVTPISTIRLGFTAAWARVGGHFGDCEKPHFGNKNKGLGALGGFFGEMFGESLFCVAKAVSKLGISCGQVQHAEIGVLQKI